MMTSFADLDVHPLCFVIVDPVCCVCVCGGGGGGGEGTFWVGLERMFKHGFIDKARGSQGMACVVVGRWGRVAGCVCVMSLSFFRA